MSYYEDYDAEVESRKKGETDLDRYWAKREAELAEREQQLREREKETLEAYHSVEAQRAADAARYRAAQLEITSDMTGQQVREVLIRHGL